MSSKAASSDGHLSTAVLFFHLGVSLWNWNLMVFHNKEAFKYYAIHLGGGVAWHAKKIGQTEGAQRRNNYYQWVVQEVISSKTNIYLIRIALTKRYIIWKMV